MFRPCIDIHDGQVKQIVGGTLTDAQSESGAGAVEVSTAGSSAAGGGGADADGHAETNFVSSRPAQHFAALYAQHGLLGGHVIMLGRSAGTEEQALAALRAYPGGLQVGGGVHAGNARRYLDAGATHTQDERAEATRLDARGLDERDVLLVRAAAREHDVEALAMRDLEAEARAVAHVLARREAHAHGARQALVLVGVLAQRARDVVAGPWACTR